MKRGRLGDGALAALLGACLFAAAAVPLWLVRQPPLQDYAEHVAAAAMASRPEQYPEYAFNGFAKTNSAFVAFAWLAGKVVGVERAGFGFVLLVLAANAFALPSFVLHFGGRGRMRVAALFAPPFVHNWFVSMGMLNFSLGVSLSLLWLVALDRQRAAPSAGRAAAVVLLSLATWYAHAVPVLVVGLLVAAHLGSRARVAEAVADARALLPALVPVGLAFVASTAVHLRDTVRPEGSGEATVFQTPLWLVYDVWAHWGYGYTPRSIASLPSMLLLAVFALGRIRAPVPLFGPLAAMVLAVAYVFAPYQTVGLGYAGARLLPYLWIAALVRVPERVGPVLGGVLAALAGLYVAGMAVDQVRLAGDEDEFAAGVASVPAGTRLDVFTFSPRVSSKNTWSLATAWGEYVTRAGAHTWEMPGDTPSLPFRWRQPPPPRLETTAHRRFMDSVRTERGFCAQREASGMGGRDCATKWREEWDAYYREVDPFIDAILMWDPPSDALGCVPAAWTPAFHQGRLWIFRRTGSRQ